MSVDCSNVLAMATTSPAEQLSTPVDGVAVLGALSPSRASDFMTCPLLYRFRQVDRLPEPPSPDAVRGTVVHKVLEDLFDRPAEDRVPATALEMLAPAWAALQEADPELAAMLPEAERESWLASCRKVLERYFTIEDPSRLAPAERELYVEALLDSKLLLRGFVDRLDVAPTGEVRVVDYKGLALDTPLPTPAGWTTMGEVRVGDALIGSDGRPVQVTGKSQVHQRPCYRVRVADGSEVIADNVHQWSVVISKRQQLTRSVVSTEQLFAMHRAAAASGTPRSMWIESASALAGTETRLPIDPWLLGAWLGDGDNRSGALTVGRDDRDDMLALVKEHWSSDVLVRAEPTAWRLTPTRDSSRCSYGHAEFRPATQRHDRRCAHEHAHQNLAPTNLGLTGLLRAAGLLHQKHIPAVYLRASWQQRVELLRGLMDTDGWWAKKRHRAGFTTTDDRLAHDVEELLRSLGASPQRFTKPYVNAVREPRTRHILEFTPGDFNPFSLPRKAVLCDSGVTDLQRRLAKRRIIADVEPVESVPTQCIQVDAEDSLYLCGTGFIPTHNTGKAPRPGFEAKALFQMKFYALVWWKLRGEIPAMLQLLYLGSGEVLRYQPDEADLRATERKVVAIWQAIRQAEESGDWRPRRGRLCGWCAHQALCPEFGGTPPPLPTRE